MGELAIRFFVGGLTVAVFAIIGEVVKPKDLAGIFGAAPSVSLATLSLTAVSHSGSYVADEGRAMVVGAVALFAYVVMLALALERWRRSSPWLLAAPLWLAWLVVALGGGLLARLAS